MKDGNRYYKLYLTVKGPVYIGESTTPRSKKEYIYLKNEGRIIFPDMRKMYMDLVKKGMEKKFQDYMLNDRRNLAAWLLANKISSQDIKKWTKYELKYDDVDDIRGIEQQVMTFVKDPWGNPYVPGSSLKGMLRTALLTRYIRENGEEYENLKRNVRNKSAEKASRTKMLKYEIGKVESQAFNKLLMNEKKIDDIKNDIMSQVVVSDSSPLSIDDIILCQKIDVSVDGTKKQINVLRECIKPGTRIEFQLKIGEKAGITSQTIIDAIEDMKEIVYEQYLSRFKIDNIPVGPVAWLGGGTGYATKTVIYSLFENENGYRVVDNIMKGTLGRIYDTHKHYRDSGLKVSPHKVKATKYKGQICQMGMVQVEIEETNI